MKSPEPRKVSHLAAQSPSVGQREIQTQQRVLAFFQDTLGYAYLGHWKDRPDNANVEEALLTDWLKRQGYSDKIIANIC